MQSQSKVIWEVLCECPKIAVRQCFHLPFLNCSFGCLILLWQSVLSCALEAQSFGLQKSVSLRLFKLVLNYTIEALGAWWAIGMLGTFASIVWVNTALPRHARYDDTAWYKMEARSCMAYMTDLWTFCTTILNGMTFLKEHAFPSQSFRFQKLKQYHLRVLLTGSELQMTWSSLESSTHLPM